MVSGLDLITSSLHLKLDQGPTIHAAASSAIAKLPELDRHCFRISALSAFKSALVLARFLGGFYEGKKHQQASLSPSAVDITAT